MWPLCRPDKNIILLFVENKACSNYDSATKYDSINKIQQKNPVKSKQQTLSLKILATVQINRMLIAYDNCVLLYLFCSVLQPHQSW